MIKTRLAEALDIEELLILWETLMTEHQEHHFVFHLTPSYQDIIRNNLLNRLADPHIWIWLAEIDGQVAGMLISRLQTALSAYVYNKRGYIAETVVKAKFRSQGVGKALAMRAAQNLKEQGADHIELQVSTQNPKALIFWKKIGYEVTTYHLVKAINPSDLKTELKPFRGGAT